MLEVIELSRRYGDVVALDRLSFEVEPGQLFGFVGPNGAGKTTTMRIILGVAAAAALIPLSGRIYSGAALRTGSAVKVRDAWRARA